MTLIKRLIKKRFPHFVFFYRWLRHRIFVTVALSILVGLLDSFGLIMFLPLLQLVLGNADQPGEGLGGMDFVARAFEHLRIPWTVGGVLAVLSALFGAKAVLKFAHAYYKVQTRLYFVRSLRFRMSERLVDYSYKDFVRADAGRIQNTMTAEVVRVQQGYLSYFGVAENLIFAAVYCSMALIANAHFSLLVGGATLLSNRLYQQIYRKTRANSEHVTTSGHEFQRLLIQKVAFFKYLKATGFITAYNEKLKQAVLVIQEAQRKIGLYAALLASSREPLTLMVVASALSAQVILLKGEVDGVIPSLIFFYRAFQHVLGVQLSWTDFLSSGGAFDNLGRFLSELTRCSERYGTRAFSDFRDRIEVRDVDFYYGDVKVLDGVTLTIPRDRTVALVGESGSGKTTLVNLVCGLMPADSGSISIDGVAYPDLDARTLQQRIGYITQDPVIFSGSIYENVTRWDVDCPENLERFWSVLEQAAIADFVRSLPKRERTELGIGGLQVSGGQKQRLSIARELYRDVAILVMDEATSALDSETERAIHENIDALRGRYTIIIVAHRLSTIKEADTIYLFSKGKLVASGSYRELVANSAHFRRMTELQST